MGLADGMGAGDMTIGWKVVNECANGDFTSAIMFSSSKWCVLYVVGKPTTGINGTPVLAFRTREQARIFKAWGQPVFRARLDNPRPQKWIATYYHPSTFAHFWLSKAQRRFSRAPEGTLACDAITLLERA